MSEYYTKDEYDDYDKEFFKAHNILVQATLGCGAGDLENAAVTVTKYALESGDRGTQLFFLARFADFIEDGKLPPLPMRLGFRDVMNALARPNNKKCKGRPKMSMFQREWARTDANMVANSVNIGDTQEIALEKTVAFRAAHLRRKTDNPDLSAPVSSESTIKRNYLKFRKLIK